jgi:hypothetical protein
VVEGCVFDLGDRELRDVSWTWVTESSVVEGGVFDLGDRELRDVSSTWVTES